MKKEIPDKTADALIALEQFVYHAAAYWQSYWSLDSKESHDTHRHIFEQHDWWYGTTRESYFMGSIISIYKFFEKNDRSINIWHYLDLLDENWKEEKKDMTQLLNDCGFISKDIIILRNNYYSHHSKKLSFKEVFKKTSMSYNHVPELIQRMADILNVSVRSLGGNELNPKSIADRTRDEMLKLLNTLDKNDEQVGAGQPHLRRRKPENHQ